MTENKPPSSKDNQSKNQEEDYSELISLIKASMLHDDTCQCITGIFTENNLMVFDDTWWNEFKRNNPYPLYGIFLATGLDTAVASFVQSHYAELDKISGKNCALIFFRDINRAKNLSPFQFSEHAERIYSLIQTNKYLKKLPCLLFFTDLTLEDRNNFVAISLKGKSDEKLTSSMREIFSHLNSPDKSKYLTRLKRFQRVQGFTAFADFLLHAVLKLSNDTSVEALKNIVDNLTTNDKHS